MPLKPRSASLGAGALEMDYDTTSSDRKSVAKSVASCRKAIENIKGDMEAWGKRCESAEVDGEREATKGRARLADEMGREVLLVAITPTKQRMASSVGREVGVRSNPRSVKNRRG